MTMVFVLMMRRCQSATRTCTPFPTLRSADLVVRAPCMGLCDTAPVAEVGHHHVDRATVAGVVAAADGGHTHPEFPDYEGLRSEEHTSELQSLMRISYAVLFLNTKK